MSVFDWKSKPASAVFVEHSKKVQAGLIGGKKRAQNLGGQTMPGFGHKDLSKTAITLKRPK